MSPPRANPAGRARPISAQVKPKNTIITRSNSADKLLQVTSARMVSLLLHTFLCTRLCTHAVNFVSIITRALKSGVSLVHVHLIFSSAIAWTDLLSIWYI